MNSDYIALKSLLVTPIIFIVFDTACQWHKNLLGRMKIPPSLGRKLCQKTSNGPSFLLPPSSFLLATHVEACNLQISFNLTKGVGRTGGEAPERGWANINPAALSTKEMSPGTRRDTLDDRFGDWNWKKTIKMGMSFIYFCSLHAAANPMFDSDRALR